MVDRRLAPVAAESRENCASRFDCVDCRTVTQDSRPRSLHPGEVLLCPADAAMLLAESRSGRFLGNFSNIHQGIKPVSRPGTAPRFGLAVRTEAGLWLSSGAKTLREENERLCFAAKSAPLAACQRAGHRGSEKHRQREGDRLGPGTWPRLLRMSEVQPAFFGFFLHATKLGRIWLLFLVVAVVRGFRGRPRGTGTSHMGEAE